MPDGLHVSVAVDARRSSAADCLLRFVRARQMINDHYAVSERKCGTGRNGRTVRDVCAAPRVGPLRYRFLHAGCSPRRPLVGLVLARPEPDRRPRDPRYERPLRIMIGADDRQSGTPRPIIPFQVRTPC